VESVTDDSKEFKIRLKTSAGGEYVLGFGSKQQSIEWQEAIKGSSASSSASGSTSNVTSLKRGSSRSTLVNSKEISSLFFGCLATINFAKFILPHSTERPGIIWIFLFESRLEEF
jgi:hypothetical protein